MSGFDQLFGLEQPEGIQGALQEEPQTERASMFSTPEMQKNAGEVEAFGLFQKATNEDGQIEPASWSIDSAGRVKGDMPAKDFFQLLGGFRQNQQTQAAFNAEALRLKAQEDKIRANPLLSVLSAVAAGAAQDPRMPPIVRALGYANASLNPSPDSLAQRRMGILQTLAQLEGQATQAEQAAKMHEAQLANMKADNERADRAMVASMGEKAATRLENSLKAYDADATNNTAPTLVPRETYMETAIKNGSSYQDAEQRYRRLETVYEATKGALQEKATRDVEIAKLKGEDRGKIRIEVGQALQKSGVEAAVEKAVRIGNAMIPIKAETHAAMITAGIQPTVAMAEAMQGVKVETAAKIAEATLPQKKEMADYSMKIAMEKAANLPLMKLAPKEIEALTSAKQTIHYFEKAIKMVEDPKYAKYLGNIRLSRITETKLFQDLRSDEQQQILTFITHERPRIVELSGAKSYGYRPSEWPIISKLGGDESYTPSQLREIFKLGIQYKQDEVRAMRAVHPLAPKALFDVFGFPDAGGRKLDQAALAHFRIKNGEIQTGGGGLSAGGFAEWVKSQGQK